MLAVNFHQKNTRRPNQKQSTFVDASKLRMVFFATEHTNRCERSVKGYSGRTPAATTCNSGGPDGLGGVASTIGHGGLSWRILFGSVWRRWSVALGASSPRNRVWCGRETMALVQKIGLVIYLE